MAKRGRHRAEKRVSLLREVPILGALALLIALLIKTFLAQAFFIPSGSMENTLQVKDRVIVNKLSPRLGKEIKRGQIVVFKDPGGWLSNPPVAPPKNVVVRSVKRAMVFVGLLPSDSEKDLIKRVIGVPGDQVSCCDAQKRVMVNGVPLDEPYIFPDNPPSTQTFSVTVPPGRLWVMGDHRSASADSRAHMADPGGGTIPIKNVIGPAFVVLWPAEHLEVLKVPGTFKQPRVRDSAPPAATGSATPTSSATPPASPTGPVPSATPATPAASATPKPAARSQAQPTAKPKVRPTAAARPTGRSKPTGRPTPKPSVPTRPEVPTGPLPTPTETATTPPTTPGVVLILPPAVLLGLRRRRGRRVGHHG